MDMRQWDPLELMYGFIPTFKLSVTPLATLPPGVEHWYAHIPLGFRGYIVYFYFCPQLLLDLGEASLTWRLHLGWLLRPWHVILSIDRVYYPMEVYAKVVACIRKSPLEDDDDYIPPLCNKLPWGQGPYQVTRSCTKAQQADEANVSTSKPSQPKQLVTVGKSRL